MIADKKVIKLFDNLLKNVKLYKFSKNQSNFRQSVLFCDHESCQLLRFKAQRIVLSYFQIRVPVITLNGRPFIEENNVINF